MCSLCGGNVCAGSGGCMVVINQAPEVVKITYSYTSNALSTFQSYLAMMVSSVKNSLFSFATQFRRKN